MPPAGLGLTDNSSGGTALPMMYGTLPSYCADCPHRPTRARLTRAETR